MSFLVDPPMLFLDGELYSRLPESAQGDIAKVVGGATVLGVLVPGVASYLNQRWTKPMWKPFGAKSGRDFMLNWPFFDFEHKRPGTGTHAVAAVIFATYPLAWWLGWDHGRRRRPRASS